MDATYTGGQGMPAPTAEDYRQYDRIWQRVAPNLNPYPQVRQESGGGDGDAGGGAGTGEDLEHLPGAQADPCCMGSAAMDSLQVVAGFIEDERAGRQFLLDFASRVSQPWIARPLRQMAEEKAAHLRHLTAAYYPTTGSRYAHTFQVPASSRGDTCCQALRSAYHEAACLGFNYLRAADGTADLCLQHMFQKMGRASFRQSERLLHLVSACIRQERL